ncbi:hypothetical protein [Lichenicola sp.]|uniref:hypothetical protein n=1 Tax=Lichenicola sp. TaxID=2804529 RepID=UPI003B007656
MRYSLCGIVSGAAATALAAVAVLSAGGSNPVAGAAAQVAATRVADIDPLIIHRYPPSAAAGSTVADAAIGQDPDPVIIHRYPPA